MAATAQHIGVVGKMLLLASSIKLIAEIAWLALLGQWMLGLLAGRRREHNVFYQLLQTVASPFVKAVRRLTPRVVLDRHVPFAAFMLLMLVWLGATFAKINLCLQVGVAACH